jgi:TRAP transporter TAXI family solute receptor
MKKSRLIFVLSLVALFAIYSTAGAEGVKVDKSKWPKRLAFGGSVLGASDYIICNGIANILTKKLGLDITVQATAGNVGNVRMINAEQSELSVTTSGIYMEGLAGTGWTKGKKYDNVRVLMVLYPKVPHFWALAKSGIKDIMDLNGKRVNLSKAGSTADMLGHRVFDVFSIKPSKITNVEHVDANNLMRDGLIDAAFTVGLPPLPAVAEMSLTDSINVIGFTKEQSDKFIASETYLAHAIIPKGTYKGIDYDVPSVADTSLFITSKNMPIDFAYMVTKTVIENLEMLHEVHKSATVIKPENISQARGPLHQGAYLYYKDKGMNVPEAAMPRE